MLLSGGDSKFIAMSNCQTNHFMDMFEDNNPPKQEQLLRGLEMVRFW